MSSKTLVCKQCHGNFEFSEGEQKFYTDKGFQTPRRCQGCRTQPKVSGAVSTVALPQQPQEKSRAREVEWIGGSDYPSDDRRNRRSRGRKERHREYVEHDEFVGVDGDE